MANNQKSTALVEMEKEIGRHIPQLAEAAAGYVEPERLKRLVLTELDTGKGDLWKCTPESVVVACMNAASLGLEPTGILGDAYLIRYGNRLTLQIGYKGFVKLMKRTGDVKKVEARAVWDVDHFRYQYGIEPILEHIPGEDDERDHLVNSYAIAWLPEGLTQFEVMTASEIAKVKGASKAAGGEGGFSPWDGPFEPEMWRKSAIRRLANHVELSAQVRTAIAYDNAVEISGDVVSVDELDPEVSSRTKAASDARMADLKGRMEDAKKPTKASVRKEIKTAIDAAGLSQDDLKNIAQTTFAEKHAVHDATGRVDSKVLNIEELELLRDQVTSAVECLASGEILQLVSWDDPTSSVTLGAG